MNYGQPYYGHQSYGQQIVRPYTRATHNSLNDFKFPEFPKDTIVNFRPKNAQQDVCKSTCTPFLKKEVINRFSTPWITEKLYEIHGLNRKVRYVEKDSKGDEINPIYAEEHTPINSSRKK